MVTLKPSRREPGRLHEVVMRPSQRGTRGWSGCTAALFWEEHLLHSHLWFVSICTSEWSNCGGMALLGVVDGTFLFGLGEFLPGLSAVGMGGFVSSLSCPANINMHLSITFLLRSSQPTLASWAAVRD